MSANFVFWFLFFFFLFFKLKQTETEISKQNSFYTKGIWKKKKKIRKRRQIPVSRWPPTLFWKMSHYRRGNKLIDRSAR